MSPDEPVTRIFLMLRDVVTAAVMGRYAFPFGRRSLLKVAAVVRFSWGRSGSAGCCGFHCERKKAPQPLLTKSSGSAGFATSPGHSSSGFRPCTDELRLSPRCRPWPAVSAGHGRLCGNRAPDRGQFGPEDETRYLCRSVVPDTEGIGYRAMKRSSPPSSKDHDISGLDHNNEIEQQREVSDVEQVIG